MHSEEDNARNCANLVRNASLRLLFVCCGLLPTLMFGAWARPAAEVRFGFPVDCELDRNCFIQQTPDIDPGNGILDSNCGSATYDGHDGWDIRLRSLKDIERNVAVIAVADGKVLRMRDNVADRIYEQEQDKYEIAGKECGNGLVLAHANGISSQYCHLKKGSLAIQPGANVRRGQILGAVGSSGLAQFPHLHFAVRREGKLLDPLTGRSLQNNSLCGDFSKSLFEPSLIPSLSKNPTSILQSGLSSQPPQTVQLTKGQELPMPHAGEQAFAWIWVINAEVGTRLSIRLESDGVNAFINEATPALVRRRADILAYFGRKSGVPAGRYKLIVKVARGAHTLSSQTQNINIFPYVDDD